MNDLESEWFFTFGFGQRHAGKFVKIFGTYLSARKDMVRRFGTRWSMQYATEEEAGVKEWEYQEITVDED